MYFRRSVFLVMLGVFIFVDVSHAVTIEDDQYVYHVKDAPGSWALWIPGFYSAFFLHELGHAVMPLLFFGYPTEFKPWPMKKGHYIILGSTKARGPKFSAPFVEMAGFAFNSAAAYFGALLIPKANNIYLRNYLIDTAYCSAFYLPWYLLMDLVFNLPMSDFKEFKKSTGIGIGWFILPAIASGYFLFQHVLENEKKKPNDAVIVSTEAKVQALQLAPLRTPDFPIFQNDNIKSTFSLMYNPATGFAGGNFRSQF